MPHSETFTMRRLSLKSSPSGGHAVSMAAAMYRFVRFILIVVVLLAVYLATVFVTFVPLGSLLAAALLVRALWRRGRHSIAYGSARWADASDVPHLLEGHGLIVGHINGRISKPRAVLALLNLRLSAGQACKRFLCAFGGNRPVVRLTSAVHTAVFAPTGCGKGVSCVVPYLLTCPDPMVVVDFKGELVALTAKARRKMGHRIVVLDPYRVTTQQPDTFNPVQAIDPNSSTALDDCRELAEALVIRSGQEKEPHWCDSAEIWIAAMLAAVVAITEGEDKSLQSVRTLLTDPRQMEMAIKFMCESPAMDGMLSRLGHQLTHFKDKELSSTLTTTNRFLRFLDTTAISESTKLSSFDSADLVKGKMTVYLVLPPDRMRTQAGLLRLWIGSMLRAVVKNGLQENMKVRFILDEAASLGHMTVLDDAVDKLRGYGVRLLFLYQSLGQLKACFPDGQDQTLLSNVTQVFFGINDQQTADYVSSRLGETTLTIESGGTSSSTSWQAGPADRGTTHSSSSNRNWQFMGRKLLKPEEVAALPERVAITFTPGAPPIATRLIRYYERDFKRWLGPGPLMAGFRAMCLLILMFIAAVMITAVVFGDRGTNRTGGKRVQGNTSVLRAVEQGRAADARREDQGGRGNRQGHRRTVVGQHEADVRSRSH